MSVTIDTRVAFLEGQVGEHSRMIQDVRQTVSGAEDRIDRRFESIDRKLDERFGAVDKKFDALDQKFAWLVGIQLTTLVAMVAALLAR